MKHLSFALMTLILAAALPSCSDNEGGPISSRPANGGSGSGSGGSDTGSGTSSAGSSSPGTSGDVSGTGGGGTGGGNVGAGGSGLAGSDEHDAAAAGMGGTSDAGSSAADGAVPSSGCGLPRTLKDGHLTIQTGGTMRTYYLRVPSNYDNKKPYRLILGFHWRGSEGDQVDAPGQGSADEKPYYGLMELAQGSTIFVAPDGIGQGWGQGAADLTFTDDILKQVEGDLCIDKSRIFSTGFSFGAAMSYALACARPGMLRAIVLYAGGVVSGCMGGSIGTPIPYLETHGTDDGVFPISPVTQNNGGPGKAIRNAMVKVNGCTAQDPSPPANGSHKCTDYAGCSAGHPVRWCEHDGEGGHWPSAHDKGQSTTWIPAEAWKFITQY